MTEGSPQAIASSRAFGVPSKRDVRTKNLAALRKEGAGLPNNRTS